MIKIRYASLPEGLHIQARREGGHTIIYLRPGLTSDQRREALRRARQSARMGHGPRLPVPGLARALAADRAMSTLRNAGAAIRHHPFGAGMLAALVAGAVVSYSLFVTVSVHLIYPQVPGLQPTLPHPTVPVPAPQPGTSSPGAHRGNPGSSPGGGVAPTPAGSVPGGTPSPPPRPPTPAPSPSSVPPTPTPTPTPTPGSAGVCVNVGPLGVCLSL